MKLSEKIAAIESGEYAVTWTTPDFFHKKNEISAFFRKPSLY